MMITAIIGYASAANILTSQYLTETCSGAPLVMYNFTTSDISLDEAPKNEVWPFGYQVVVNGLGPPLINCGSVNCKYMHENDRVCFNPLDDSFLPYGSVSSTEIKDPLIQYFPPGTEGVKYCHLIANSTTDLLGMQEAYILEGDVCVDGVYKCLANGILHAYPNASCAGNPEIFSVDTTSKPANSTILGTFFASVYTIPKEPSPYKYIWNAWVPDTILIPRFKIGFEIFALICFILAFLISMYALGFTLYGMISNPQNRKIFMYNQFVCYFFIFVRIILKFLYWILILNDEQITGLYAGLKAVAALGSLCQVWLSTHIFLFEVHKFQVWQRAVFMGLVISVHIALAGSSYLAYFANDYAPGYTEAYTEWRKSMVGWEAVSGIYLNLLPLLIIYRLLAMQYQKSNYLQRFQALYKIDKFLVWSIAGQIVLQISYAVQLQSYIDTTYGDDRIILATAGVESLTVVLSTCLVIRIATGLRAVGRHRASSNNNSSTAMSKN